MKVEGD